MLIPMHAKGRSLQGPHSSCTMTAETYINRYSSGMTRATPSKVNVYTHTSIGRKQFAFNVYFCVGLVSTLLFCFLGVFVMVYYFCLKTFIRFQYKLMIVFVVFHIHVFDFRILNRIMLIALHILMFLVGGLGYVTLLFCQL